MENQALFMENGLYGEWASCFLANHFKKGKLPQKRRATSKKVARLKKGNPPQKRQLKPKKGNPPSPIMATKKRLCSRQQSAWCSLYCGLVDCQF
jgi:hypothetical protein